jgi:thiamine biosynthesis lipoprotein
MGSRAHVLAVDGPEGLCSWAEERLRELEARWTRFSEDSEISLLNAANGDSVSVHPDTIALVLRSCDGWRLTGGRFDPTTLPSILAAGYEASLDDPRKVVGTVEPANRPAPGCADVHVDVANGTVRLPRGVYLDPGGIGKGLAADLVATEMVHRGAAGALVNVGGDLRAAGRAPTEAGWVIGVEDPFNADGTVAIPRIGEGGVATTTPDHRRWRIGDTPGRHVIDPDTGRPSTTEVASVTVLAGEAWMAEVMAKAAAVAGFEHAVDVIDDAGVSGIVIAADGRMRISSRLGVFL